MYEQQVLTTRTTIKTSIIIQPSNLPHSRPIDLKDFRLDPAELDEFSAFSDDGRSFEFGSFANIVPQKQIPKVRGARGQNKAMAVELTIANTHYQVGEQRFLMDICWVKGKE